MNETNPVFDQIVKAENQYLKSLGFIIEDRKLSYDPEIFNVKSKIKCTIGDYMSQEEFDKKWEDAMKMADNWINKEIQTYKRSDEVTAHLLDTLAAFFDDFPQMRLGQTLSFLALEGELLHSIYDEEIIRRLNLFRDWQKELSDNPPLARTLDWATYLRLHPNERT